MKFLIPVMSMLVCVSILCSNQGKLTLRVSNAQISIVQGDILEEKVQGIVNAANQELKGGSGVCGAIFTAAHWERMQAACNQHPILGPGNIRCPVGQARITDKCALKNPIKWVIHAVGPDARLIKDECQQQKLLTSAYQSSLQLADEVGIQSIAFPFISSGIYAVRPQLAAQTAVDAVYDWLRKHPTSSVSQVTFVLFDKVSTNLFAEILKKRDS